jgi:hypothetical protein
MSVIDVSAYPASVLFFTQKMEALLPDITVL